MTFITPYVTDEFTTYNGDVITTYVPLVISLTDDFTKKEAIGNLKVIIKEGNVVPIKNLSGYYIFTRLPNGTYTVSIESELYFPTEDIEIDDISKIKGPNLRLEFYTKSKLEFYNKGPSSRAISTRLKDVSKLYKGCIVEFNNANGGVEQKKIIDVDARTGKISWVEGLKYSFNTANSTVCALMNPVVTVSLKPLPSYPFHDCATLIRGVIKDSGGNPIVEATLKVASLNIETKSDKKGEFVLYFNDAKNQNISLYIEKNERNKTVNIDLEEGMAKSLGKIVFP